MNLINVKKLFPIFAILVALLIIVLLYSIISNSDETPAKPVEPVKTQVIPPREETQNLPQEIKSVREQIIASKIEIDRGDVILYRDNSMDIIYVPTPDIFFVNIHQEPADEIKKQAQEWFLKFGLEQTELCTLPVRFNLDFNLKKVNPDFDALPEGCSL